MKMVSKKTTMIYNHIEICSDFIEIRTCFCSIHVYSDSIVHARVCVCKNARSNGDFIL